MSAQTYVPMSAFRVLLSAVTGEAEMVPELQLRKWLQILINRSLVLGTWEKPQVQRLAHSPSLHSETTSSAQFSL